MYIYAICYTDSTDKKLKYFNLLKKLSLIVFYIAGVIMIFMPLKVFDGYMAGPALDFVHLCSVFCMAIWFISILKNIRKIEKKKFIPVILFVILTGVVAYTEKNDPTLTVETAIQTFVIFLMFFTNEKQNIKKISEELEQVKEPPKRADRMKSRLLSSMTEMKTSLDAIVNFSNSLFEDVKESKIKDDVKFIADASENLLEYAEDILDISKIEDNKLELIDADYKVNDLLGDLVNTSKAQLADKLIELKVKFDEELPLSLKGDSIRVKQICSNLLKNSIKYTDRGYIEFKVDSIVKGDTVRLIISIEDSGIGIKKEEIDKLFTKFDSLEFDNDNSIEGSGLKLAITKKLIEMMNGKIIVQSEYGIGSKFIVAIDQKLSSIKIDEKKSSTNFDEIGIKLNTKTPFAGKKLLIIDDDPLNLKVAEKLLQSYNVDVTLVKSIDEGITAILADRFDLVLLDGIDTLKEIKEKFRDYDTPSIMLTANVVEDMREKCLDIGFADYLTKPIEKPELDRVLNKFLK